jgi:hypothetical protein
MFSLNKKQYNQVATWTFLTNSKEETLKSTFQYNVLIEFLVNPSYILIYS